MRSIIITVFLALMSAPLAAQVDCIPATGEPVRIGAVFTQGGLLTAASEDALNGAEAMREAINGCGGVNGRPVAFVSVTATNRESATDAITTLTGQGVTLIIGSGSPAVSETLAAGAAENGYLFWDAAAALTVHGEGAYSPHPTAEQLGAQAAQFVQANIDAAGGPYALIYETRPRAFSMARGVTSVLPAPPTIERAYEDSLSGTGRLGVDIREAGVSVVFMSAFDDDALRTWYALQEADANISGWVQLGSDGYRRSLCTRSNIEGFISVTQGGPVSRDYRESVMGGVLLAYERAYLAAHSVETSADADLSAAGTYLLLAHVLPRVEGAVNAENVAAVLDEIDLPPMTGMMGEGLRFSVPTDANPARLNVHALGVIQQQQGGRLCSLTTPEVGTCMGGAIPFPTWYEREVAESQGRYCIGEGA